MTLPHECSISRFYYNDGLRYIVSGGAGFIGSHLCDRLLEDGHEVLAIDNLITGSLMNLEHRRAHSRFQFVPHDIIMGAPEVNGRVDGVYHLASPASPRDYQAHPIETLRVGSEGTLHMLELARRHEARFLLTSTSECYGDPLEHPQAETYWGNVNPVGPRACYDESKRYAEALTMSFQGQHGVRTNIARIFNTYGPRMKLNDGRIVPTFLSQALRDEPITVFGSGAQTRSFCYVADMVEGLLRLSQSDERLPVNLGNPEEMTVLEFAQRIQQLTHTQAPIVFEPLPEDDPRRRKPDIGKARRLLGWEPRVGLAEGLEATIAYFRQVIR